jgi:hypothetical protein
VLLCKPLSSLSPRRQARDSTQRCAALQAPLLSLSARQGRDSTQRCAALPAPLFPQRQARASTQRYAALQAFTRTSDSSVPRSVATCVLTRDLWSRRLHDVARLRRALSRPSFLLLGPNMAKLLAWYGVFAWYGLRLPGLLVAAPRLTRMTGCPASFVMTGLRSTLAGSLQVPPRVGVSGFIKKNVASDALRRLSAGLSNDTAVEAVESRQMNDPQVLYC